MSSYLRALRHKDFKYLFLGQSASALGDQIVIVALALYITRRTGSATDLGLVLAAQSLPMIALLVFGGVWADRVPRHRLMMLADGARALLHAVLAASIYAGGASIAELVVIEALFGAARAFFEPAYSGLLPQTLPEGLAQDASGLTSTTSNLAFLVGPALGAGMVLTIGAGSAFAVDAATFVLSAGLLAKIRPRQRGAEPAAERSPLVHELRAGWREVSSRPWVWATIAAFTGAILFAYAPWYTLAPTVARAHYGGVAIFGVLESVAGGGALAGALIGVRWRPRRPLALGLAMVATWPAQSIAFALLAPLAAVCALAFAAGLSFALFEVWWGTALIRHVPPHALGRVSSYDWMGSLALMPLGFAVSGPLAAVLGPRSVLAFGALAALAMLALALCPRSTRALTLDPAAEADEAGEAEEPAGAAGAATPPQPSSRATISR
ncbi:MAG: MFS transporter [Solirubrobacteraceae bacterium]